MSTDEFIIAGITARAGREAAYRYARPTRRVYRKAVLNPRHFASMPPYRRAFIMSYQFYKHYLGTHVVPPGATGKRFDNPHTPATTKSKARDTEECEQLIDEELAGSFPASDPPSWTLGGSLASRRGKH